MADDLEDTIRSFAAGGASYESLQFAAEHSEGPFAGPTLKLILEYENSGHEFDETELRRRAGGLLES